MDGTRVDWRLPEHGLVSIVTGARLRAAGVSLDVDEAARKARFAGPDGIDYVVDLTPGRSLEVEALEVLDACPM